MFISKIAISNFRNFRDVEVEFNNGINVIIGPNNGGKTNLLNALGLIFNSGQRRRLEIDDFCRNIDIENYFDLDETTGKLQKPYPPSIEISIIISESVSSKEQKEDKEVIYDWLIKLEKPYEAQLTYRFFLPEAEQNTYEESIHTLIKKGKTTKADFWKLIQRKLIHKYISRIYGGDPLQNQQADLSGIAKFDFQFLDAIRDVEKSLFSGRNTLLKDVLNYFLDYELKQDSAISDEEKSQRQEQYTEAFELQSQELIKSVRERIHTEPILQYSRDVGAAIGGEPDFEGETFEHEIFSTLRLILKTNYGLTLPIIRNGLGYNNLIFMSVLLAKMQVSASDFVSEDEQKIFPMLLVEEPEAHLHPSMQFKFLRFLKQNLEKDEQVRQVFVSTHSTHITAAADLDEIICLHTLNNGALHVAYPGRVFASTEGDQKSKTYVKRFLDAVKSDMLFAQKILLVEGLAEQILLPCLANYCKDSLERSILIEDRHISIIAVDGACFKHFLKLFDYDSNHPTKRYALPKKVACITDADPSRKEISANDDNTRKSWRSCYPYEIDISTAYEYKAISSTLEALVREYENHTNIGIFGVLDGKGKTLEYELAKANPSCELILSEHLSYLGVLKDMMTRCDELSVEELLTSSKIKSEDLKNAIRSSSWDESDKKLAVIATRYLQSVGQGKGEHALALSCQLRNNLLTDSSVEFKVPDYIQEAFSYVCN